MEARSTLTLFTGSARGTSPFETAKRIRLLLPLLKEQVKEESLPATSAGRLLRVSPLVARYLHELKTLFLAGEPNLFSLMRVFADLKQRPEQIYESEAYERVLAHLVPGFQPVARTG